MGRDSYPVSMYPDPFNREPSPDSPMHQVKEAKCANDISLGKCSQRIPRFAQTFELAKARPTGHLAEPTGPKAFNAPWEPSE